jgi:hypothetical protein
LIAQNPSWHPVIDAASVDLSGYNLVGTATEQADHG